ncbi:hypothetical protein ACFX1Z_004236 [Malus domestica]
MASVDVQLPVHRILHDWALQIRGHVSKPIVFISLFTWSEVLSRNFVPTDLFLHHDKVIVAWENMRATLDSAIWFSLVYKGFTIIGWNHLPALVQAHMIHILYGERIQTLLSRGGQGSNKTEWKRNIYLIHLFTYTVQSNEYCVICFLTSDSSSAAWIKHVCSVLDQMTNPLDGVPKCFDYWNADLALFLQHKMATYRMLGADSLLYFRDYQGIQSSMESLHWCEISSTFFGVLRNNNCLHSLSLGYSYSLSFGSAIYGRICL